jgi:hypothetical protein
MRRREGGTRHEWAGPPGTGVPSDIQHPCADWLRHISVDGGPSSLRRRPSGHLSVAILGDVDFQWAQA